MNLDQINQVKSYLNEYNDLNLAKLISETYIEENLDQVYIGSYSVREFLHASSKVFKQFEEELDTAFAKALPFSYQFQNEYGGADLNQDLSSYLSYTKNKQFDAAVTHLNRLIHYQAINGFWEKSKRKYFRTSEINVQQDKERIELISNQLEAVSERLDLLVLEIHNRKDDLEKFTLTKQNELTEIESLVTASRNRTEEITNLQSQAAVLIERINALLDASNEKKSSSDQLLSESKSQLQSLKNSFEELVNSIEAQQSEYETLKDNFESKLGFVESKHQYFTERNEYLDDLIGREVGVSLFETFKQRKTELDKPIFFWKCSIPVIAVVSIAWIFYLFWGTTPGELSWQFLLINSLKTLPVLGILFFTISQYTKERNFQEEYAFKSAVALTVKSYAEQLKDEFNQDKLIMESVQTIYTPPSPKNSKVLNNESSSLENLKQMIDQVKEIKSIIGDGK